MKTLKLKVIFPGAWEVSHINEVINLSSMRGNVKLVHPMFDFVFVQKENILKTLVTEVLQRTMITNAIKGYVTLSYIKENGNHNYIWVYKDFIISSRTLPTVINNCDFDVTEKYFKCIKEIQISQMELEKNYLYNKDSPVHLNKIKSLTEKYELCDLVDSEPLQKI